MEPITTNYQFYIHWWINHELWWFIRFYWKFNMVYVSEIWGCWIGSGMGVILSGFYLGWDDNILPTVGNSINQRALPRWSKRGDFFEASRDINVEISKWGCILVPYFGAIFWCHILVPTGYGDEDPWGWCLGGARPRSHGRNRWTPWFDFAPLQKRDDLYSSYMIHMIRCPILFSLAHRIS